MFISIGDAKSRRDEISMSAPQKIIPKSVPFIFFPDREWKEEDKDFSKRKAGIRYKKLY